jgi:hypothetical protein
MDDPEAGERKSRPVIGSMATVNAGYSPSCTLRLQSSGSVFDEANSTVMVFAVGIATRLSRIERNMADICIATTVFRIRSTDKSSRSKGKSTSVASFPFRIHLILMIGVIAFS